MSSRTLPALAMTRDDATVRAWWKAAERVRRVEAEALAAFAELYTATARAAEEGFALDVELSAGMAAFYSTFKQELAREQGRDVARADHEQWSTSA